MRSKTLIGRIAAVAALAGLGLWLALAGAIYRENLEIRRHHESVVMPFNAVAEHLQLQELSSDLQELLSRLPRDKHRVGFALVDPQTLRVVVGDAPEAAGMNLQALDAARIGPEPTSVWSPPTSACPPGAPMSSSPSNRWIRLGTTG